MMITGFEMKPKKIVVPLDFLSFIFHFRLLHMYLSIVFGLLISMLTLHWLEGLVDNAGVSCLYII